MYNTNKFWILFALFTLLFTGCGGNRPLKTEKVMKEKTSKPDNLKKAGLGPWTGSDNVPSSSSPPFGLNVSDVPQFLAFGFDDNGVAGNENPDDPQGVTWALKMFEKKKNRDNTSVLATFYLTSSYATGGENGYDSASEDESPVRVKQSWHALYKAGHEIGNHTDSHPHGDKFTVEEWIAEMKKCMNIVSAPFDPEEPLDKPNPSKGAGIPKEDIIGFRTPFLEYNDNTFQAIKKLGMKYDCSIEDGYEPDRDGTNFTWPYTLDSGSKGHDQLQEWELKDKLHAHPGLWEMPVHPVIVPPDSECEKYGVKKGLRAKMKAAQDYFDPSDGKITGFDYNLWVLFQMTKEEVLATLKYTLDLRLRGNRAPFMLGMHTDIYADGYDEKMVATTRQRQEAIEEFVDYALSKPEIYITRVKDILSWVRNPVLK
jgi:peptidoglycan/xylan/chitin deacetylase (PgdA/CDA1 family)